jgi:hypothetical protein
MLVILAAELWPYRRRFRPLWRLHWANEDRFSGLDIRQEALTVHVMQVLSFTPPGYDDGAFRLAVDLNAEERAIVASTPSISFELPQLARRSIHSDHAYTVACSVNGVVQMRGVLIREGWFGHCYTNGVAEQDNPTPMATVIAALETNVNVALTTMRGWYNAARGNR